MKTYTIIEGDTLQGIAGKVLGDPTLYRSFKTWNPVEIANPDTYVCVAGRTLLYRDTASTPAGVY